MRARFNSAPFCVFDQTLNDQTGTPRTEITRVPLQPIAKGVLTKLWLGVLFVALSAAGLVWASLPPDIQLTTITAGTGPSPTMDDVAMVKLKGELKNHKVFQPEASGPLALRGIVPGFSRALLRMQKGGKYRLMIPAKLGYGDQAPEGIPANSDLYFDIDLLGFMNADQYEQQQMMMQQMQQQGGAGPGGPGPGGPGQAPPAPEPKTK